MNRDFPDESSPNARKEEDPESQGKDLQRGRVDQPEGKNKLSLLCLV